MKRQALATAVLLLAGVPLVQAQDFDHSNLYLGADAGGYKSRGGEFDDSNMFGQASIGYQFNRAFGIEASYIDFDKFGKDTTRAKTHGGKAAAHFTLPISDNTGFFLKAGELFWETDLDVGTFSREVDDHNIFYGAGFDFRVSNPLSVILEYERYKVEFDRSDLPVGFNDTDTDIDALSIGLRLHL